MNDSPARAVLVALAALLFTIGGCAPVGAASAGADVVNDPQVCAENALRRRPDPGLLSEARALFSRGCAMGQQDSCSTLGVLYELGLGMRADRERARALYRGACEGGNARACANLGELMLRDASPDGALALLRMSCSAGQGRACQQLGRTLADGILVPRQPAAAAGAFARACQRGEAAGCVGLADLLEQGLVEGTAGRATELLMTACARGDEEACARRAPPAALQAAGR